MFVFDVTPWDGKKPIEQATEISYPAQHALGGGVSFSTVFDKTTYVRISYDLHNVATAITRLPAIT